ncbi:hypothetical protein GCM10022384_33890 [Streptomyces marokkonensis]|uniref:Uncharacterized protein n=1 Tax=Streptomyces marokkonensis TaxID=324855 RepID=A0ABP7QJA6_9ACTN
MARVRMRLEEILARHPGRTPEQVSADIERKTVLDAVDLLGRINPARDGYTCRALRTAQALVDRATALRDAPAPMHRQGETQLHATPLARALRVLDGERRTARVSLPPCSGS